jgi:hypothetical protein
MSCSSDMTDIRRARALIGAGCPGPQGPKGDPAFTPVYASFLSMQTQPAGVANPVAITYSEKTIGNMNVLGGTFPNTKVVIPTTGIYRVLFSAQVDSNGGTHYLEIFPVINNQSVPKSNTRIRVGNGVENCLTVEYFLSLNQNDTLELFMIGDSNNIRLLTLPENTTYTPDVPSIPSIILTLQRID